MYDRRFTLTIFQFQSSEDVPQDVPRHALEINIVKLDYFMYAIDNLILMLEQFNINARIYLRFY